MSDILFIMSHTIEFSTRGLAVTAEIEEVDHGSREDPPSGGAAESISWEVEDIDEVMEWLDIESAPVEEFVLAYFKHMGRLPLFMRRKIDDGWDLEDKAEAYFWFDLGGVVE